MKEKFLKYKIYNALVLMFWYYKGFHSPHIKRMCPLCDTVIDYADYKATRDFCRHCPWFKYTGDICLGSVHAISQVRLPKPENQWFHDKRAAELPAWIMEYRKEL